MAFESLTDKLQNVFKNLRSKGRLTEADVKAALKEVKMALLEADVNFKVVKQFVKAVEERAIGADVMNGLNPGQMVIKIVNEEMVNLMGSETTELALQPGKATTVIMMCGLQGAGKTTAAAKIAGKLKLKGKKPLLVACDIYRPAAIEQLSVNAQKIEADFFSMGVNHKPVDIVKAALEHAAKNNNNVVIIDKTNLMNYLDVPDFFWSKLENNEISIQHFSDYIRTRLLYKYGGIWMDATLFLTDNLDEDLTKYGFYTIRHGERSDYHICEGKWSTFFMASCKGNKFFKYLADLQEKYWRNEKYDAI